MAPVLYFFIGINHPLIIKPFPDPFTFNNGTRVATVGEWDARRGEIKDLLLGTAYGTMPARPDRMHVTTVATSDLGGGRTLHVLAITIVPSNASMDGAFNITTWVFVPAGGGPFPVVLKVGKDGEGFSATAMDRGHVYACFNNHDLDPDTEGHDVQGPAQLAYPTHSWGSIAAWAWGAMRVLDYLLGEPWVDVGTAPAPAIDPGVVAITGHSRRGKVALLAGALDERFTMVVPNGSGCGGAGSFLVQGPACETIAIMTAPWLYKAWFMEEFGRFGWNEASLPFDQHFLRALVAPRVMLSMDAVDDYWANPVGTQAVYDASMPVFSFLNASSRNGIHFRAGGHDFTLDDFGVLLDFADTMLRGIARAGEYYTRPFPFVAPVTYAAPA